MAEEQLLKFEISIDANGSDEERFGRFWSECFRLAIRCFPTITRREFPSTYFVVDLKDDSLRVSGSE